MRLLRLAKQTLSVQTLTHGTAVTLVKLLTDSNEMFGRRLMLDVTILYLLMDPNFSRLLGSELNQGMVWQASSQLLSQNYPEFRYHFRKNF